MREAAAGGPFELNPMSVTTLRYRCYAGQAGLHRPSSIGLTEAEEGSHEDPLKVYDEHDGVF